MGMVFCRGCGKELHDSAPICPHCGAPQGVETVAKTVQSKSQTSAALLSAFLGGFGAHRFYLGPIWLAIVYLLFCWTGIPGLVAIVETFIIVFSSQETWARKYNNGVITPPAHIAVKILVLAFPVIALIGILAAIAIPQYAEYTSRAKIASVQASLNAARIPLIDHMEQSNGMPLSENELTTIEEALRKNKEITETDAFAYGNYADVGAQLRDGGQLRSFYLVTNDRGQTWQCLSTDADARRLPKNCVLVEALLRPEIQQVLPDVVQSDEQMANQEADADEILQQKLKEAEERGRREALEQQHQDTTQSESSANAQDQTQVETTVADVAARASVCDSYMKCFNTMLEAVAPRNPEAIQIAATRISESNKARRGDRKVARELNARGLDEYKKSNYSVAIDLLQQAAAADPADVEIQSNLGFVALRAENTTIASAALTNALHLDPRRTSTWIPLAELLVQVNTSDLAVRAVLLGYEFSANKEKSMTFFEDKSITAERVEMRPVYASAIQQIKANLEN